MLSHRYLIGMFAVNFIYEVIVTVFDFNFKIAAGNYYCGVELSRYLSLMASSIGIVSLGCLLLGISNVTRFLGLGIALAAMPVIVGFSLFGFMTAGSLSFLFGIMGGRQSDQLRVDGARAQAALHPHDSRRTF
ncbi:MAG: hypothetical protein A3I15_04575 [Chlamydiae bacterium RIFCSPLOWO2_02_FULL_49_12]|nr:MAG: hypothetical protein A3I15_04575 [Chlamydiae bacterium RIFCSPLOWO2_02_FULL_49_12]